MKRKILIAVLTLTVNVSLMAQTAEFPWAIGLYGVKTEYLGDMRYFDKYETNDLLSKHRSNTVYDFHRLHLGAALSLERYLSRFFDIGLYGSYSSIGYTYKDPYVSGSWRNFDAESLRQGNLHLRYKFLGSDKAKVVPYVTVGAGVLYYTYVTYQTANPLTGNPYKDFEYTPSTKKESIKKRKNPESPMWAGVGQVGVGLEWRISDHWGLRYQVDLGCTTRDDVDYYKSGRNDLQLQHSLGLTFNFGKKDSDKDGVADKKDLCPDTQKGVKVDANGCPIDSDGDGVPDYLDKCPNEAGTIDGCPDSDGDGVIDNLDKCPNTPKGVKVDENGCPIDSDGDGVADYLDKCPNTPKGVKVDANGCPIDSDGDGVADYLDKCPDTPAAARGKIDANGCPLDTDGDGIPDYLDKCPTIPGVAANNGCPEVKAAAKQAFQKALNGIQFETGKSTIKKTSNPVLDEVAKVLKENPDYNIDIKGHTDNVGDAQKNLTLSIDRAEAVKNYLVKKGIAESRMKIEGFGDTKPVADNNTAAGRTQNRRVEFVVIFER